MTPLDLLAEFRAQMADEDEPYLWTDDEAFRYVVDAQDMFCRLTGGLKDATTPDICEIPFLTGDPWADFSPYILRFRAARLGSTDQKVSLINYADLENGVVTQLDYGAVNAPALDGETGEVRYAVMGMEEKKLRLVKVPQEDDVLKVMVMRLPYPRMDTWDDPLEIGEQHHLALVMWMKHKAYLKHDSQTYDKALADRNEVAFKQYCSEANKEAERLMYKPRQVRYGGI